MKQHQIFFFLALFSFGVLQASNDLSPPLSVIVFAPHPDDDVIGCGGAIIQHVKKGDRVCIVYLTSGDAWPKGVEELAKIRELEATEATALLGVQDLIFFREPDGYLAATERNKEKVIQIILEHKPDIVYVTHEVEEHKDHKAAFRLVIDAIKKIPQETLKKPQILSYEVWTPLQKISMVKNISREIELKLQALREHKSQLKSVNYIEAVKGLNRYRGIMKQKGAYAECFNKV